MADDHADDEIWHDDDVFDASDDDLGEGPGDDWDDDLDDLDDLDEDPAPVRRGPARPPRRGQARGGSSSRPGEPGGVLAEPMSGEHLQVAAIAGGYVEGEDDLSHTKLPRWVLVVGSLVVVIALLFGAVTWWYNRQLDPPGSPGAEVTVQIPRGASTSGIGSILERNDVIPNSMVFNFYSSRKGAGPFEAGAYVFQENSSVDLALEVLEAGPTGRVVDSEVAKLTVPEGLTVGEIVARTNKQIPRLTVADLEKALGSEVTSTLRPEGTTSLEGLLFPATYDIGPDRTAGDVLGLLAAEMQSRVARLDPESAVARINSRYGLELTTYDLLIVASMVQAEAAGADEAPMVASVIYNRLADTTGQFPYLGIDAVDEYGAELEGITPNQYRATDGVYNTRNSRRGLPPTPIGAPGDYALGAAFTPSDSEFLYYVLTSPGEHSFAVTQGEHQSNVAICRQKNLGC